MKVLRSLMILLSLFGFQSCEDEDQYQLIDFKTTGVSLEQQYNAVSLYGEILSSETEMIFTAVGKNARLGFLVDFQTDDEFYYFDKYDYDNINLNHKKVASGNWGNIEFTNSNPYTTNVVISENTTSKARIFKLRFGGEYTTAWVTITQKASEYPAQ